MSKKMTKTEQVRMYLTTSDFTPMEIAKKVGVSKSYVYGLKAKMTDQGLKKIALASATRAQERVQIVEEKPLPKGNGQEVREAKPIVQLIELCELSFGAGMAVMLVTEGKLQDAVDMLNREMQRLGW